MDSRVENMADDPEQLRRDALAYHRLPSPGKIETRITMPAETARDLSLAYSPGVGEPVRVIAKDPAQAYELTSKGNLVGIISNGSAILGLGNLGALASKPVMEGKSLLFKRFADIDCFDIEVKTQDVDEFVSTVVQIADTFGAINLEDIGAPACFEIERQLKERLDIPVFHDDQHGTAIVTAAGLLNALEIQGKQLSKVKVVCLGAGAAAMACMNLLFDLGLEREQLLMVDSGGVIHSGRDHLTSYKQKFAVQTNARTLADACRGADVFIGVSGANLLAGGLLSTMAARPVVFAMANPDPEILPAVAQAVRDDIIMATGRSDFPNQVNNVLCFPFIFRGALDVRASEINQQMKMAAVKALSSLAREPVPEEVLAAYPGVDCLSFGPGYILPKPMDPRLLETIPVAVAQAARESGVAKI
jgi:malate dehydrogenase (oxaloacetate-decarboxylating)(NADP+)